jgi:hypothetical protein
MSLYSELSTLIPYLQSIRKIENFISIDVLFPQKWKLPKAFVDESKVMEQKTGKEGFRLLSFVSELNDKTLNNVKYSIIKIIEFNLEREQKDELFKQKVNSLKEVFENKSLFELQNLTFDIKKEVESEEYSLDNYDEQEYEENSELVSEGVEEGRN